MNVKLINGTDSLTNRHGIVWFATVPVVLLALSTVTIIGNILVIVAFTRDKRIRDKVPNIIILNLSITDLLIGLFILPVNTFILILRRWPFGEFLCKAWLTLDYTLCSVSVFTIVHISFDRYWLVRKRLKYAVYQTRRRVVVTTVCAWCACVVFYVTLAFGWTAMSGQNPRVDYSSVCEMEYSYSIPMTLATNIVEFIIPFFAIIVLNLVVYCTIRRGSREIVRRRIPSAHGMQYVAMSSLKAGRDSKSIGSPRRCPDLLDQCQSDSPTSQDSQFTRRKESSVSNTHTATNSTSRRVDLKQYNHHRKAAFLLAILVAAFLICWLPYQFTSIRLAVCGECVLDLTWEITNNLLWCNSAINPFLYAFTNVRFGQQFRQFLCLGRGSRRRLPISSQADSEM